MDELNHNFGRLSTTAAEWKPNHYPSNHSVNTTRTTTSTTTSQQQHYYTESDLNPTSVKEFVPGQGWNSQQTITSSSSTTGKQRERE
jgi:hypothetical protein